MAESRRYINVADQINKYRWRVKVPAFTLTQPNEYMTGELDPIYSITDPYETVVTVMTINKLLELFQAKVLFAVIKPEDAVEIFYWIDRYLEFAEPHIHNRDPAMIAYCRGFLDFREWFYRRIFLRALNKNPALKKNFVSGEGSIGQILAAFGGLGNESSAVQFDPIAALAKPPITLPPLPEMSPNSPREVYAIEDRMIPNTDGGAGMDVNLYA